MRSRPDIFIILLALGFAFSTTSCSREKVESSRGVPSAALEGGGPVYSAFTDHLRGEPYNNDFMTFASNPKNFTVSIRESDDQFVYTFVLKPYSGGPVLDEGTSYSWSKKDGKVERTLNPNTGKGDGGS